MFLQFSERNRVQFANVVWALCVLGLWSAVYQSGFAQTIIYQEGFNDDGDGTRYTMEGRGHVSDGPDGLASWEHSFNVSNFEVLSTAPAKRAAMLFEHDVDPDLWTDETLTILDNLVDWAIDEKENAQIYFLPLGFGASSQFLSDRLQARGHSVSDLELGTPIPNDAELIINTSEERPDPLSMFVGAEVPLISFNARGHDSALVVTRGASTRFDGPVSVDIGQTAHPVLGGQTGTIAWTNAAPSSSVRGLGPRIAPGGTLLATYQDPVSDETLPALVVVEKGDELLGSFVPAGIEGNGFLLAADLNLDFGGFPSSEERPKAIQLAPIDVSGQTDVRLTVALAASEFDMDSSDYLRVLVDSNNSGDFEVLSEFRGNERFILDDGTSELSNAFVDVSWEIPGDATNMVIRFEAHSTFPNEQMGIDNVRITIPGIFGDFNGNGILDAGDANELVAQIANETHESRFNQNDDAVVDSLDLEIWVKDVAFTWFGDANLDGEFNSGDLVAVFQSGKFEQDVEADWSQGDWTGDQRFDSGDFVAAFQDGGFEMGPRVVTTVPESIPHALVILVFTFCFVARRNNRNIEDAE